LFDENKEEIKPTDIKEDTKLEYYDGIIGIYTRATPSIKDISTWAKKMAAGEIDRVPIEILNTNRERKQIFYKVFNMHRKEGLVLSKTAQAGLNYIKK
jgi:hypothetical protein